MARNLRARIRIAEEPAHHARDRAHVRRGLERVVRAELAEDVELARADVVRVRVPNSQLETFLVEKLQVMLRLYSEKILLCQQTSEF